MQDQNQQRIPGRYGLDEIEANRLAPWPNPHPDRDYVTHFEIPEFTCLCPRSGFPDFATIVIDYVPDKYIVELKSLKLYINGYRNRQISHESVTNRRQARSEYERGTYDYYTRQTSSFNY